MTGTCFIKPTVTEELLNIHSKYCEQFKTFNEKADPYYLHLGVGILDCSLAIGLTTEKLKKAFNFSLDRFKPLSVTLNDIGLVKIDFKDGNCVSSIRMRLMNLNGSLSFSNVVKYDKEYQVFIIPKMYY